MSSAPTRARTAVAAALLALLGTLAVAPLATAAPAAADPGATAAFVATTLAAGGDHYVYPGGSYLDGGNTIDAILALDGAHVGQAEAAAATAYLVAHLGDYVGTGGETYAGPTAKSLLAVLAQGLDPHSVGGVDLLATLTALQATSGRFSDVSAYGDYSNTIGQSLAVIALARAGATVTDPAVAFLVAQQCPDGGFRVDMGAETCTSDPDATGFAVQALLALATPSPASSAAAAAAGLDFLAAQQGTDGGLASASGGPNANTTGVAAQAFAAGGRAAALAQAQSFLASLQYGCSFPAPLRGGIAFTTAELAARQAAGSTATPTDSDLRSTPQSALGLAGGTLDAVTSTDASATAPAMVCAAPSPTPTATTTSASAAPEPSPSASVDPAVLASTGASVAFPALLGLGLVAAGAAAMLLSARSPRRGARR